MTRIEIITDLMKKRCCNVADISKLSGLPYTTVKSILERGVEKANYINVSLICKSLGITTDDLEKLFTQNAAETIKITTLSAVIDTNYILNNKDEISLIEAFRKLSTEGKQYIYEQIKFRLGKEELAADNEKRAN